ncbi:hypothetical protein [Agromyces cerinus]|uniref:Uncharacterized protein n=1 Tax=Agromyces cerinus subsp. cerinus TaxID=232089 RepID=A0A1N6F4V2_9MICO|nr:hypothetical protein [Agromyces cerinus]SIN90234.1 hypothetical protein SAMN05443544_1740 [Agromyces cerinus subsp. cerinus]
MITKRVMTFGRSGAAAVHLEGGAGRRRGDRMLGLALAGLIVVTLGIAGQAQSAEAAADLEHAKRLAVAEVGGQVGIGAAGVDIAALRDAAAAHSATEALRGALAAHREAVEAQQAAAAAKLAAEAAAAEAVAAEAAAAEAEAEQVADEGDDWSGESDAAASASSGATEEAPAAAPAADPYTSEYYPGLPPAPRDEDCGPCTGKEMVPVYYNGSYVWGCDA